MAHTSKGTVLALAIQSLINTNKVALDIDTVLYGDQDKITPGITAVVQAGVKNRQLDGVVRPGARTMNEMMVLITIYNNRTGSEATERLAVDQIAEAVETLLHTDTTMGGLVFHGFVVRMDPGIKFKAGSMFRATQMTYVGRSKTNLSIP